MNNINNDNITIKGHEIAKYITSAAMPDIEQVRAKCLAQEVNQKYRAKFRYSRKKLVVIYAAVIMSVLALMSVGVSVGYHMIMVRVFDADGNYTLQPFWWRGMSILFEIDMEQWAFEQEFRNYENALIIIRGEEVGRIFPHRYIRDYDELQKFMDGEIFKLPQYIPIGYRFSHARAGFFVCEDFSFETGQLLAREEKFGNVYERWYIPENPANMESITIWYAKETDGREYLIWYTIALRTPNAMDNIGFAHSPETAVDLLYMSQFERAFLSSRKFMEDGIELTHHALSSWKTIPTRQIRLSSVVVNSYLSYEREFGTVVYSVVSDFLTRDEILKIAESIR